MDDYKTIRIRQDTYSRLKKYMHKKELDSLSDAIGDALKEAEDQPYGHEFPPSSRKGNILTYNDRELQRRGAERVRRSLELNDFSDEWEDNRNNE